MAQERSADLIVVGTRGQGPIGRLLGGSVSTGVVHHADRLVVRLDRRAPGRSARWE